MKHQATKVVDVNTLPAGVRGYHIGHRYGEQVGEAIVNAVAKFFTRGRNKGGAIEDATDAVPMSIYTPIDPVRLLATEHVAGGRKVAVLDVDGMVLKVPVPAAMDDAAINRAHATFLVADANDQRLPIRELSPGPGLYGYEFLGALNGAPELAPPQYPDRPTSMN